MKRCPFCDTEIDEGLVVCSNCGRDQWTARIPLAAAAGVGAPSPRDQVKPTKTGIWQARKAVWLFTALIALLAVGLCGYHRAF